MSDRYGNNPFFYADQDVRLPMGIGMLNHNRSETRHDGKYYDRSKYFRFIYGSKKVGKMVLEGLEVVPIESSTNLVLSERVD